MNPSANISNSSRKYVTRDEKKIVEELYELARELEKLEKESLD
jgi:hypothetical protein